MSSRNRHAQELHDKLPLIQDLATENCWRKILI